MKLQGLGLRDIFCIPNGEAIVKSLIDTDVYKWFMAVFYFDHAEYRDVETTFKLIIRDKYIRLADIIPEDVLREQLEAARALCLTPAERSFLAGMTGSDGRTRLIRSDDFLEEMSRPVLPPFILEKQEGGYVLTFTGPSWKVTFWEIIAMVIVSELYYYHLILNAKLSSSEILSIYTGMVARLFEKAKALREERALSFILFDTRRRQSRFFQEIVMRYMSEMLPSQCLGTSNVLLAMQHGSANPKGTNAHELYMIEGCLAGNDHDRIFQAPFTMSQKWYDYFGPDMSILLPDTYGTAHFYRHAPASFARDWKGVRPDSMEPNEAVRVTVEWWKRHGVDPMTKMILPSDGLDTDTMLGCSRENASAVGTLSYGWGTLVGNDCRGLWPRNDGAFGLFRPFSMVCKVSEANGVPAVKLSDNPEKATGPADRVALFKKIFGEEGSKKQVVVV
ncbi:MAG: nicotinate phosphoribosyltransferase [Candidatus Moranbacteria bacterium]|nr:nicotinate phosphoribosyltransferase [Candidatus Moranbacteria bacterium]